MNRKLIIMGAAITLMTVVGNTQAQQDEEEVITQEAVERMEREITSGVVASGKSSWQYQTGCVSRITVLTGSGTNAMKLGGYFMIHEKGIGEKMYGFTPNGIRVAAHAGSNLTVAQWRAFAPVVAQLRQAVQEKVKVQISYTGNPAYVHHVALFNNEPCP